MGSFDTNYKNSKPQSKKSYGKKVFIRNLTRRKQCAIERARVWEVKTVENVTLPKTL